MHAISDALTSATTTLTDAGIADARIDAELLAAHVLAASRGEVQMKVLIGGVLDDAQRDEYEALVARRALREPLQHLTGVAPFRHLELQVGKGVFVPRPETEVMAQYAIDALRADASAEPLAVDLGTGSGAIAIAMATEVPHARIVAVERSADAHAWAARNVHALTSGNLELRMGDFATALADLCGTVAVVASNPPYVPADAIPRDPEVRLHDPAAALYSGPDGLDDIRTIARVGLELARSGGAVVLEHGEWQGAAIREILHAAGWVHAATHQDLTLRDRVTTAYKP